VNVPNKFTMTWKCCKR